jgi:feruloyl esterase
MVRKQLQSQSRRPRLLTIPLATLAALTAGAAGATSCESLTGLALPHTRITSAVSVGGTDTVPAYCSVTAHAHPSDDSDIIIGIALPASTWNGKYLQLGNGGYAGTVPDLTGGVAGGYATAGTDDGHQDPNVLDASWALGHPQKVIDFGYRALKETTDTAKAVIAAFYGNGPQWSYFRGCSDGGREALQEAQRYPADWDGIVVGAPANYWTHLFSGFVYNQQELTKRPVPPAKLPAIQAEALRQCDAADGVVDGVNGDPQRCQFDPELMRCGGAENDNCLTDPQIKTLRHIMAGPRDPRDRTVIFPGYQLNAIADPAVYPWIFDLQPMTLQAAFGDQFYINMVFEDPNWDYRTLNRTTDIDFADAKLAGILNSTDPDLSALQRKGAKVLMYHGWEDNAISPKNSIDYYDSVEAFPRGNDKEVKKDTFLRLFLAPGMAHCGGGPGPNVFDALGALVSWVEQGVAPERIVATKYVNDDPSQGVLRTRPLCPYPMTALWSGHGSTDDAANFTCALTH